MSTKERVRYYDTIKAICIFQVPFFHFLAYFHYDYERFYYAMPYKLVTFCFWGKVFIVILGEIMAILAYTARKKNSVSYSLTRYIYFLIGGMIINAIYVYNGFFGIQTDVLNFLRISFSLSNEIYSVFWCMRAFFIACVVSAVDKYFDVDYRVILLEVLLFALAGFQWVAICLMGTFVASLFENEKVKGWLAKKPIKLLVLVVVYFGLRRVESEVAFYFYGVCIALFLLVLHNSHTLKRIIGAPRIIPKLSKYSMTIFLTHYTILLLVAEPMYNMPQISALGKYGQFLAVFAVYIILVFIASILLQKFLDWVMSYIKIFVNKGLGVEQN